MKKIIALTDYKNRFGSKHFDVPYRSGMDKSVLQEHFTKAGFAIEFKQFTEVINEPTLNINAVYIYTSSEDGNYLYKSFIEDVILKLELAGCRVIPFYKFLRANNNKVFMELLRSATQDPGLLSITSKVFGTKEELMEMINTLNFPLIVKTAEGASGTGVYKAGNKSELIDVVSKVSSSKKLLHDLKDHGRSLKHKGYIKESVHRNKFIVQNMVDGLVNDWKVYFFYDKLFIFYRPILKHRDFKASGGGYDNYLYGEEAPKPSGLFEFVDKVISHFDVPHASLDIAFDGTNFHLIEAQFLYFGTAGIPYSKGYYVNIEGKWNFISQTLPIEEVYANSIIKYLTKKANSL